MELVAILIVLPFMPNDARAQLPQLLREERNALIHQYAARGVYTASEIAAILAAAHGIYLRYTYHNIYTQHASIHKCHRCFVHQYRTVASYHATAACQSQETRCTSIQNIKGN